jgi:3'-phosphoadenosine 5'-phosphosulfate sulfotransferase (PAPS reductase)/FAD synthetase
MLENEMPIDQIIYVDTGYEFPEIYEHIEKVEELVPLEIDKIQIDFDYWFYKHVKTKGKNKGQKGYGWPDFRNRWCTRTKVSALSHLISGEEYNSHMAKWSKHDTSEVIEYHGIAYDESHRTNRRNPWNRNIKYPLVEWGITEEEALKYCYNKGFTWGGLYEEFNRLSCYICPLSSIKETKLVWKRKELWEEMERLDSHSRRTYRPDYSLQELNTRFNNEEC